MLVWGFINCYLAERGFRNDIFSQHFRRFRFAAAPRCFGSGCQSRNICSMFGLWLACAVLTGPL